MDDANRTFHLQLDELDDLFTAAGLRLVAEMPRLINGFLAGEQQVIEEARTLMERSADDCTEIEDRGFLLLARNQPVGRDLRRMVALLRMTTDVDRSAALLRHVRASLRTSDPRDLPPTVGEQLGELALRASEVFGGGIRAWRSKDPLAVNELDRADEDVDRLQRVLLDTVAEDERTSDDRLSLGLVARYLERIADHGVAIARDAAFVTTGERVPLPSKAG